MNVFEFISRLRKKTIEPSVYVFLMQNGGVVRLVLDVGNDFHDIIEIHKKSFLDFINQKTGKNYELGNIHCDLHMRKTPMELFEKFIENKVEETKVSAPEESHSKNELIKHIIDTKNTPVLGLLESFFTENEKKYIKEKIK